MAVTNNEKVLSPEQLRLSKFLNTLIDEDPELNRFRFKGMLLRRVDIGNHETYKKILDQLKAKNLAMGADGCLLYYFRRDTSNGVAEIYFDEEMPLTEWAIGLQKEEVLLFCQKYGIDYDVMVYKGAELPRVCHK